MNGAPAQMLPTVLHPAIAWATLAAVGIPVAIHLLAQLRRTVMPWAAMRFVSEAIRRHRRRWRLEQWLLLAVRIFLMLIAGLAVAGLLFDGSMLAVPGSAPQHHVIIILDDSLTSRVRTADGMTRFEKLQREAVQIVDALRPGDPVALLRAARPAGEVVAPWSTDHDAVRRAVKSMAPRFATPNLSQGIAMARRQAGLLPSGARAAVFVLSDLAHGTLDTARPEADDDPAGAAVRWFAHRPFAAVENMQIMSLVPRRRVVVSGDGGAAAMQFDATLRRMTEAAPAEETALEVTSGPSSVRVVHHWREGERVSAAVPVVLPLAAGMEQGMKAVHATLITGVLEQLVEDDRRHCLVEVRSKLLVAIIDAMEDPDPGAVPPRR